MSPAGGGSRRTFTDEGYQSILACRDQRRRQPDPEDRRVSRAWLALWGEAALEALTALHLAELRTLAESGSPFRVQAGS